MLRDIWSETEKNYSGVLASQSAVESSEINEAVVKSNALPQIKAQFQNTYGTFEGSNGASFPQQGFFTVSGSRVGSDGSALSANTFASMVTEYEIYNFGRQRTEEKAASLLTSKTKTNQIAYLLRLKKLFSKNIWMLYLPFQNFIGLIKIQSEYRKFIDSTVRFLVQV